MSGTFSELTIIGFVGIEPVVQEKNGKVYANFTVATNRKKHRTDGSAYSQPTWYSLTAVGRVAELVNGKLKKGDRVFIKGRLDPGEDGNPKIVRSQSTGAQTAYYDVFVTGLVFLNPTDEPVDDDEGSVDF